MKIKNVREPNQEEKESIVPILITFGITTAILTAIIYLMTFHFMEIGESMYLAEKAISKKTALQHDQVVKLFEAIYKRDYMRNKLEGIPVSVLASIIAEGFCGMIYKVHKTIKGLK